MNWFFKMLNYFLSILIFIGLICLGVVISSLGISMMFYFIEFLPTSKTFLDIFFKTFGVLSGIGAFFVGIIIIIIRLEK